MRYTIQSKVLRGEKEEDRQVLRNSCSNFSSDKELTIGEIKAMVKDFQPKLSPKDEIFAEIFWVGNKEMKDNNEVLKKFNGLEYNLILK